MLRIAASTVVVVLFGSLSTGCGAFTSSPAADPPPAASPGSSVDLTGTVWRSSPPEGEVTTGDNCTTELRDLTFESDGTFAYESRCLGSTDAWQSWDQANDLWTVEGGNLTMRHNGGVNRCTGPVHEQQFSLECSNANGTTERILEHVDRG